MYKLPNFTVFGGFYTSECLCVHITFIIMVQTEEKTTFIICQNALFHQPLILDSFVQFFPVPVTPMYCMRAVLES